jgi:hypothetical protein
MQKTKLKKKNPFLLEKLEWRFQQKKFSNSVMDQPENGAEVIAVAQDEAQRRGEWAKDMQVFFFFFFFLLTLARRQSST